MNRNWLDGLAWGFLFTVLLVVTLAQLGTPTYTIECTANELGIEYTVYHNTWFRNDPLYVTMDNQVAYTIWFGLYANREGVGYYGTGEDTPHGQDGVYNPDELARGKDEKN